jgi:hypothetical protein
VEYHVSDIVKELCRLPLARGEYGLSDGIEFNSHINSLDDEVLGADTSHLSAIRKARPDLFWIHHVTGNTKTILTTVKYKQPPPPPKKLPNSFWWKLFV